VTLPLYLPTHKNRAAPFYSQRQIEMLPDTLCDNKA
jgi:hypothetical protein